jgi:uncharacterized protein (TIGR03435 family)
MNIFRVACMIAVTATGFAPAALAADPHVAFEVASIKPIDRTGVSGHGSMQQSGARVTFNGYTLNGLLMYAYDIRNYQISGGPSWMASDTFVITAKAEGDATPAVAQIRLMLQALIADRFDVKLHRETKDAKVYLLEPAKGGFKLEPSKTQRSTMQMRPGHMAMLKVPAAQWAALLSSVLNRPVLDRTGATGEFDFSLDSPDIMGARNMQEAEDAPGPSIFTAIQEQLGLKLEPTKGPIDTFIIERATKPSDN